MLEVSCVCMWQMKVMFSGNVSTDTISKATWIHLMSKFGDVNWEKPMLDYNLWQWREYGRGRVKIRCHSNLLYNLSKREKEQQQREKGMRVDKVLFWQARVCVSIYYQRSPCFFAPGFQNSLTSPCLYFFSSSARYSYWMTSFFAQSHSRHFTATV